MFTTLTVFAFLVLFFYYILLKYVVLLFAYEVYMKYFISINVGFTIDWTFLFIYRSLGSCNHCLDILWRIFIEQQLSHNLEI